MGVSDRALATARLQHSSLERLAELRGAGARALDELADLLEALRTQLVLARYEGSPANDASAIVSEVWARLEGLGAVLDPGSPSAQRRETRHLRVISASSPRHLRRHLQLLLVRSRSARFSCSRRSMRAFCSWTTA